MQLLLQQSQNQPTADPKAAGLPSAVREYHPSFIEICSALMSMAITMREQVATSVKRELIKVQQAVLGQLKHVADSIEEPLRTYV